MITNVKLTGLILFFGLLFTGEATALNLIDATMGVEYGRFTSPTSEIKNWGPGKSGWVLLAVRFHAETITGGT
jgi:hypothetical protein